MRGEILSIFHFKTLGKKKKKTAGKCNTLLNDALLSACPYLWHFKPKHSKRLCALDRSPGDYLVLHSSGNLWEFLSNSNFKRKLFLKMEEVETSSRSLKNRNGKHKFWSWGQATVCNRSTNRLKDTVSVTFCVRQHQQGAIKKGAKDGHSDNIRHQM